MKILRLDLLRFGPFTDRSISLSDGDRGLHVVYGPNEAGKSSALRGLTQWLFGIPRISPDDFIHSYKNLRIGGLLLGPGDELFEFTRRKGQLNTLLGPGDEPLDPQRLQTMLDGVDEQTFRQRFAIDYQGLVSGGREIVQRGGDLGEALFSAGEGLADLGAVRDELEAEAGELFKRRGSLQRINRAVTDLAAARREVKEARLGSTIWTSHRQALEEAEARKKQLDEVLLDKGRAQVRLQRIGEALPLIARRDQLKLDQQQVADAPELAPGFAERRRELASELNGARAAEKDAGEEVELAGRKMAEVRIDEPLLAHRSAVQQLHTDWGIHRKAAEDRTRLVVQLQQLEAQIRALLGDLGREADDLSDGPPQLTRAERQRIQELGNQRSALVTQHERAQRDARRLGDEIDKLNHRLAEPSPSGDPRRLRAAIRQTGQLGDVDERLSDCEGRLTQLRQQAAIGVTKLSLWSGQLEELERLPVPTAETIDRFAEELDAARTEFERLRHRERELTQQSHELERQAEQLRLEQDVPTEDDLLLARRRRDEAWQLLLRDWNASPSIDGTNDLATAYQASVERADNLADRLRREADHVARKAQLASMRRQVEDQLIKIEEQQQAAENGCQNVQQRWHDLWQPLGIVPLSPREMRVWIGRQHELADMAEEIRRCAMEAEQLRSDMAQRRDELIQCLGDLGRGEPDRIRSLGSLLQHCEDVVAEIEAAVDRRRSLQRDLDRTSGELRDAELERNKSHDEMDRWQTQWTEAMQRLELAGNVSPKEANSVIDTIQDLQSALHDAAGLRERIAGIDRDAERFEGTVRRISELVAAGLSGAPLAQLVPDLHDRLTAAQSAKTLYDELDEQRGRAEAKRNEARAQINRIEAELAAMCRDAGVGSADGLPHVERRSARRHELEQQLWSVEERLVQLSGGDSLEAFVQQARAFDADGLPANIARLESEIAEFERERSAVSETIGSERTELRRMDGSARAAEALEKSEQLVARIRADTEQYVRVRLASVVLRRAIDRYRDKNQGPVLRLASELFSELTLGSFDGLLADYDDRNTMVLFAVRGAGREKVGVGGLSEGTESQLYLALRLAVLETYLAKHPPMPFIVDDILKDFDDDRSVAALKVLARLSERTQVILFTHHKHLVRLAEENLDHDVLFTHELERARVAKLVQSTVASA